MPSNGDHIRVNVNKSPVTSYKLELSHLLDNMNLLEMFPGDKVYRKSRTTDLKLAPGLLNSGVEMPTARIDEIFTSNLGKDILKDYKNLF